jgi:hypothetical protein
MLLPLLIAPLLLSAAHSPGQEGDASADDRSPCFILTAALAIVAGLLLSEWRNGPAIRTLTDNSPRLERRVLPDRVR